MNCINCDIEFEGRSDAKYCSSRCRKEASRKASVVTDNVTLSVPDVTDKFEFTVQYNKIIGDPGYDENLAKVRASIRTAKYWYDVPLGAIPRTHKGWPNIPSYMNGRQYFLWWKNEFKETDKGPLIHNPFSKIDK